VHLSALYTQAAAITAQAANLDVARLLEKPSERRTIQEVTWQYRTRKD